jgi:hypothetical protein
MTCTETSARRLLNAPQSKSNSVDEVRAALARLDCFSAMISEDHGPKYPPSQEWRFTST